MSEKKKKITIYDVAKAAGCSTATVSLVLHNDKRIKEETRIWVQKYIDELNYKPNYLARSLATQKTYSIGIIVPEMRNPVFSELLQGAEHFLSQEGYNVIIGSTNQSLDKESIYLEMLSDKKVDGLIVLPTFIKDIQDKLLQLQSMNFPLVLAGTKTDLENINYISNDKVKGAYIGVEHLIKKGHKHIAFVRGSELEEHTGERVEGYKRALDVYGIPFREEYLIRSQQDFSDIREKVRDFMAENKQVTGLFCLYDFIALAVIKALSDLNLSIPEDVAVVGYDNIQMGQYLPVGLTSVDGNNYKVGQIAAQVLLDQINNELEEVQHILLEPSLVIRESS